MDLPPAQPWIKAATAPLADNPELQLAAQHELAQLVGSAEAGELAVLERRFEKLNNTAPSIHKRRRIFRRGLIALPLLLIIALYLTDGRKVHGTAEALSSIGGSFGPDPLSPPESMELSSEERLLLWGDPKAPTEALQWKALWDSDPNNPAFFSDYINSCDPLPSNFLEIAREIDPDNGWFLLVQAGELAKEAVEKGKRRNPKLSSKLPPKVRYKVTDEARQVSEWTIHDPALLDEAMALIHEAATKPRFECYDDTMLRQRLALLPPERDFRSRIVRLVQAASTSTPQIFGILHAANGICAASMEMAENQDQVALLALIEDNERITRGITSSGDLLVRQLVNLAITAQTNEHLLDAAEESELIAEAEKLFPRVLALRQIIYARKTKEREAEDEKFRMHAGLFSNLTIPVLMKADPSLSYPSPEELKPGRLVEYAFAERAALIVVAVFLFLCSSLSFLLLPVIRGRLARHLGTRLTQVLTLTDYLWIFLIGTIPPLLWYILVCKLTPLSGRDIGLFFFQFQPFKLQIDITFLLLLATTAQATRWRFYRHFAPLQTGPRRLKWAWTLPLLLALCLSLTGVTTHLYINETAPKIVTLGAPILLLCYFFWVCTRTIFGKRRHAPYRVAMARILAPSFALSAIALLALYPASIAEERYWIAQDTVGHTGTKNLGMPSIEMKAAHAIQARLLKVLHTENQ